MARVEVDRTAVTVVVRFRARFVTVKDDVSEAERIVVKIRLAVRRGKHRAAHTRVVAGRAVPDEFGSLEFRRAVAAVDVNRAPAVETRVIGVVPCKDRVGLVNITAIHGDRAAVRRRPVARERIPLRRKSDRSQVIRERITLVRRKYRAPFRRVVLRKRAVRNIRRLKLRIDGAAAARRRIPGKLAPVDRYRRRRIVNPKRADRAPIAVGRRVLGKLTVGYRHVRKMRRDRAAAGARVTLERRTAHRDRVRRVLACRDRTAVVRRRVVGKGTPADHRPHRRRVDRAGGKTAVVLERRVGHRHRIGVRPPGLRVNRTAPRTGAVPRKRAPFDRQIPETGPDRPEAPRVPRKRAVLHIGVDADRRDRARAPAVRVPRKCAVLKRHRLREGGPRKTGRAAVGRPVAGRTDIAERQTLKRHVSVTRLRKDDKRLVVKDDAVVAVNHQTVVRRRQLIRLRRVQTRKTGGKRHRRIRPGIVDNGAVVVRHCSVRLIVDRQRFAQ